MYTFEKMTNLLENRYDAEQFPSHRTLNEKIF